MIRINIPIRIRLDILETLWAAFCTLIGWVLDENLAKKAK